MWWFSSQDESNRWKQVMPFMGILKTTTFACICTKNHVLTKSNNNITITIVANLFQAWSAVILWRPLSMRSCVAERAGAWQRGRNEASPCCLLLPVLLGRIVIFRGKKAWWEGYEINRHSTGHDEHVFVYFEDETRWPKRERCRYS